MLRSHGPVPMQGRKGAAAKCPLRSRCARRRRVSPAPLFRVIRAVKVGGKGERGAEAGWRTARARAREGHATENAGARTQTDEERRLLPHNLSSSGTVGQCAWCPSAGPARRGPDSRKLVTHGDRPAHSQAVAQHRARPQRHRVCATQSETSRWDKPVGPATTA